MQVEIVYLRQTNEWPVDTRLFSYRIYQYRANCPRPSATETAKSIILFIILYR